MQHTKIILFVRELLEAALLGLMARSASENTAAARDICKIRDWSMIILRKVFARPKATPGRIAFLSPRRRRRLPTSSIYEGLLGVAPRGFPLTVAVSRTQRGRV